MSYASGTTHYNLPQTVGSDKRDWTDTNQAFSDIDAAIYGAAQGASAATSAIQTINGQIETITAAQAVDEGNISTLAGKVSTLESTVGTQAAAIADVRQDLQDNIESKREASATSTHAYEIGDTFYYNDVLYKATAQIAIGGTIVPSTNCTAVTVMSEIDQLNSDFSEYSTEWGTGIQLNPWTVSKNGFVYIRTGVTYSSSYPSGGSVSLTVNSRGAYYHKLDATVPVSGSQYILTQQSGFIPVKQGDVIAWTLEGSGTAYEVWFYSSN